MPAVERFYEPLRRVEVGWEITAVRDDDPALGVDRQRGGQRLVDLDRQRIPHDDRARRRADQPGDAIADQHLAPFVLHRPANPGDSGEG